MLSQNRLCLYRSGFPYKASLLSETLYSLYSVGPTNIKLTQINVLSSLVSLLVWKAPVHFFISHANYSKIIQHWKLFWNWARNMVSSYDSETVPWSYFWNRRKALLLLFLLLAPCFYWSHPLSCKRNSSSGLAPVLLEEKRKVLSDSTSLHCKVEVVTRYMTGIPHRKVALTALLG